MQKHRKYLVVTIWVSTIAFIGAGFVGWGSYQYGSKSNSVAKVGSISVTYDEYQSAYNNIYQQYNRAMGGRLDEAAAKKMGLQKQVLQSLVYQGLIKNFAKDHGIIVSDKEVQNSVLSIPAFQKNGVFDKRLYIATLQNMQTKPKNFEANLKSEILIKKTMSLLHLNLSPLETEAIGSAIFMSDKIRYKVFNANAVQVTLNEDKLKSYWEKNKEKYMTPKRFKLAISQIAPSNILPTENEIKSYYQENRPHYLDASGKVMPLSKVKSKVILDLQLKAVKKKAQLAYIHLKKGSQKPDTHVILDENSAKLPASVWKTIFNTSSGSFIKPKIINGKYAVMEVEEVLFPKPKTFKEAFNDVRSDFVKMEKKSILMKKAEDEAKHMTDGIVSPFVTREDINDLKPLSKEDAALFLQKLFSSNKADGAILLDNEAVSYNILEQKLLNNDKLKQNHKFIVNNGMKLKTGLLENNVIEQLQQHYPIKIFLKEAK